MYLYFVIYCVKLLLKNILYILVVMLAGVTSKAGFTSSAGFTPAILNKTSTPLQAYEKPSGHCFGFTLFVRPWC